MMTFNVINWNPFLVIFVLPLVAGVGLFIFASRLKIKTARIASRITGMLFLVAFLVAAFSFAPYAWALHLESKWHPANPKTKDQLEMYLSLYSQRKISPSESDWGRDHELLPGERMTQYRLLWRAPLDVVYTDDDEIVAIYTSYE